MALASLTLRDLRNHRATRLDGLARFNLLTGENGAGKTNVLEALSLLAPGRGLRRAQPAEIAAHGGDGSFAVTATLADGDVTLGTYTLPAAPARRLVRVNGAEAPSSRLGEWLTMTWLTPAMDRLFTEAASGRRRFLDRLVLARDPAHARRAARYEAALRERNRLLADPAGADPRWLAALAEPLAEAGAEVVAARQALVADLDRVAATSPDQPFPRPSLVYQATVAADPEAFVAALAANLARDRAAGRTLLGPHRDDLAVTLAAKAMPAADCSTGEQKGLLIALLLAHAELTAHPDRPRLLLLDEVAAHLDPLRRAALIERLAASGAQVWLTGTEAAPFSDLPADHAHWLVRDGAAACV